jgi:osmotically-inducible protein OsmY
MRRPKLLYSLVLAVILSGLPACAVYRKCGFAGCPGDAKVTAEVESVFGEHAALGPPNLIRVQTLDHVVYLTGEVSTDLQRSIAESFARQVPEVSKVVNSIGVTYEGH